MNPGGTAPAFKARIEAGLCLFPHSYSKLLQLRRRPNLEKITFLNLVETGDLVLEGGANVGAWTGLFGVLAGASGRVISFEPVPSTFAILLSRIRSLPCANRIEAVNAALSDTNGRARISLPGEDSAQASLALHDGGSWRDAAAVRHFECDTWRADDFLLKRGLGPPGFIKLDVEGAELPALKGMEQTLKAGHPILHLEVCAAWESAFGYKPADILSLLQGIGYDSFCVVESRGLRTVIPDSDESLRYLGENSPNLIAAVSRIHGRRLKRLGSIWN